MMIGRMLRNAQKRMVDILGSSFGLMALSVPMAAAAGAIKLDSPGPVFYRGLRVGLHGKPFRIFKFRTMRVHDGSGPSSTSTHDPRITRIGSVLRKYKIDEFPQLINVLVGDMSLVGPRPEVQPYVDMYTDEQRAILEVRPGITDWASIRFHNEGEIIAASGYPDPDQAYLELIRPEKLRLQLKYVRQRSMFVDFAILYETVAMLWRTRTSGPSEIEGGQPV